MWGIITSILYIECGIVSLLVLPIVSLNQWQRLINSNSMRVLSRNLKPWIYAYVFLMTYFLLNSLRVMNRTISPDILKDDEKLLQYNFDRTLAQRNFYISAASIFLMALTRRLILMKRAKSDELADFFNFGVEYKNEKSEYPIPNILTKLDSSSTKDILMEPVLENSNILDTNDELRNWADIEEWSSRMRRITASLVREEKNNEVLRTCAKRLSNFCVRLDEDYQNLQNIISSAHNIN